MSTPKKENWIDDFYSQQRSHFIDEFSILKHYTFRGNEKVLNIGCGKGDLTMEIGKLVPQGSIVATDRSEISVKFAQEAYPPEKYPNLKFIHVKAKDLKYEQEFDLAISLNYLNWVGYQIAALQKINRALKSNAYLLGMFYNSSQKFLDSIEIIKGSTHWKTYFSDFVNPIHLFMPSHYHQLLIEAGFQPIYFNASNVTTVFNNKQDFKKNLLEWLPHVHHIAKELQEKFLDNLIDIFTNFNPPDSSGKIKWDYVKLEFKVLKK